MKNLLTLLLAITIIQYLSAQQVPDAFGLYPSQYDSFRDEDYLIDSTKCFSVNMETGETFLTTSGRNVFNDHGQLTDVFYTEYNLSTGEETKKHFLTIYNEDYYAEDFYAEEWDDNTGTWIRTYHIDYTPTDNGSTRTVYSIFDVETNQWNYLKRQTVGSFHSIGEPDDYWQELWIDGSWVYEWKISLTFNAYDKRAATLVQNWDAETSNWVFTNQNFYTYEETLPHNLYQQVIKSWVGEEWKNTFKFTFRNYSPFDEWESKLVEKWNLETGNGFWEVQARTFRTFNAQQHIEMEVEQSWNGVEFVDNDYRRTFEYDENGNLSRDNSQKNVDGEWVTQAYCVYFRSLHPVDILAERNDMSWKMSNPYRDDSPINIKTPTADEKISLRIVTLNGETLSRKTVYSGRNFSLHTNTLPVGIYLLLATGNNGQYATKKMVIKH